MELSELHLPARLPTRQHKSTCVKALPSPQARTQPNLLLCIYLATYFLLFTGRGTWPVGPTRCRLCSRPISSWHTNLHSGHYFISGQQSAQTSGLARGQLLLFQLWKLVSRCPGDALQTETLLGGPVKPRGWVAPACNTQGRGVAVCCGTAYCPL